MWGSTSKCIGYKRQTYGPSLALPASAQIAQIIDAVKNFILIAMIEDQGMQLLG